MDLRSLNIDHEAYPYLVAQRGALDDMKAEPQLWCDKYMDVLLSEFRSIEPYLPTYCKRVLDVGSGLGGINILLNEHYGGCMQVTLLDGIDDPPEVSSHSATFNHMGVARRFLKMNGLDKMTFIDANNPDRFATGTYDLIVSFKSWCFHTPPAKHLDLVRQACRPGTRIILDVRGGSADRADQRSYDYMRTLTAAFKHRSMVHYGLKFETHMFEAY